MNTFKKHSCVLYSFGSEGKVIYRGWEGNGLVVEELRRQVRGKGSKGAGEEEGSRVKGESELLERQ